MLNACALLAACAACRLQRNRVGEDALGSSASFGNSVHDDQVRATSPMGTSAGGRCMHSSHHAVSRGRSCTQALARAPSTVSLKGRNVSMFKNDPSLAWASVADASTAEEGLEVRVGVPPQPRLPSARCSADRC